jgi:hypothetical protein
MPVEVLLSELKKLKWAYISPQFIIIIIIIGIDISIKLERIQRKFTALCHNRFSQDTQYHYDSLLEKFNFPALHIRRRH